MSALTSRLFRQSTTLGRRFMGHNVQANYDPNPPLTLTKAMAWGTVTGTISAAMWKSYHFDLMRALNVFYDELDKKTA
jgi:hypothetical protein